ncbi:hypothetical protein KAJ87_02870 [Candidatus Pacearchaeota archaeon]|nr:hypothetical protein [Candidatus Pacearchaeota archaeon]
MKNYIKSKWEIVKNSFLWALGLTFGIALLWWIPALLILFFTMNKIDVLVPVYYNLFSIFFIMFLVFLIKNSFNHRSFKKRIFESKTDFEKSMIWKAEENYMNNYSLKIEDKTIKIKFENYQINYPKDNRLTLENQLIKKRQYFNALVFQDLQNILLSKNHNEFDPSLKNYKELIIEYEDVGMNVRGDNIPVTIARIKCNLENLKSKNIVNIFHNDRWDLFLQLIDFKFNKFPTGADGFRGYQGDIED